jgi:hypothetical protein
VALVHLPSSFLRASFELFPSDFSGYGTCCDPKGRLRRVSEALAVSSPGGACTVGLDLVRFLSSSFFPLVHTCALCALGPLDGTRGVSGAAVGRELVGLCMLYLVYQISSPRFLSSIWAPCSASGSTFGAVHDLREASEALMYGSTVLCASCVRFSSWLRLPLSLLVSKAFLATYDAERDGPGCFVELGLS